MWRARICGAVVTTGGFALLGLVSGPHIHRLSRKAVGGSVSAFGGVERRGPVDRFLLEREVGVEVDAVGRADVLVSEDEGDGGWVDFVAQEFHRAAVAKGVGRDFLGAKRRASVGGGRDVAFDQSADGVAAERAAFGAGEKRALRALPEVWGQCC
jgi:hypothetical protein